MPLILESHDSLPYIDAEITSEDREKATAAVQRELRKLDTSVEHQLLPPPLEARFTEIIEKEIQRIEAGRPREGGIDLTRYEELDEPSQEDEAATWRNTLRTAYISSAYLAGRHINLALLEELGKNAWLMGNSQLDQILKSLDQELAIVKEQSDSINRERKSAQEASKGELLALDDTWKRGIGRLIEVQLATDQLRHELHNRT